MKAKQAQTLEALKKRIMERNACWGSTEVKKLEVSDEGDLVFLVMVVGAPGDEGTFAAIFARDYRHIMIKRGGGCQLLNPKAKGATRNRGIFHCVHNLT